MPKLVIGMTVNKGFTLIEILVVIVIIGITLGFAMLAFGDFGASKRIVFAAEQLGNTLKLAEQQAILETSTLGLRIENNSYQILKYEHSRHWKSPANKGIFKVNYLPANTTLTLKTNNKTIPGTPSIIINPSGQITPFTLSFAKDKGAVITVLSGSHDGTLTFTREAIK